MSFEFVVVENPSVKRSVDISIGGRAKKLAMVWGRLGMEEAADMLESYQSVSAFYVDIETGESLDLMDAAKDFITVGETDGQPMRLPVFYDGVEQRSIKDRLTAQRAFLRELICGVSADDSGEDIEPLLQEWNLTQSKEVMDFTDPEVFDAVFKTNEFFFPVLNDIIKMLNELVSGADKVKNSKTSASSSRGRRGALKA